MNQLDLVSEVLEPTKFQSLRRMLLWEGAVLVATVFGGGLVLVILTNRERSRSQQVRNFFSNFAHDLKTSLTRLRLRTEMMSEKHSSPEFQKLLDEVSRLDLQLENSLWVARGDVHALMKENISLSSVIGFLRMEWPELEIKLLQDADISADGQALKSVFRNIFQNSYLHGKASSVEIKPVLIKQKWQIDITDNGEGFSGDYSILGSQLLKSNNEKGNGLGLYLTQDLVNRMGGQINFLKQQNGFALRLILPAGDK